MSTSIHDEVGWFNCANVRCQTPLDRDHITVITTTHMRRFCSVECIAAGQTAWRDRLNDPEALTEAGGDPQFEVGSLVTVKATGQQGTVTSLDAHSVCAHCHCPFPDVENHDGTCPACPGPWLRVKVACERPGSSHFHNETYAEHELAARIPEEEN